MLYSINVLYYSGCYEMYVILSVASNDISVITFCEV